MTPAEYAASQQKKILAFAKGKGFELAVRSVVALRAQRIFEQGKKSDGTPIGKYDTTHPLYVNPNKAKRATKGSFGDGGNFEGLKPTRGKTGEHLFKNGREHKTTYVNNYKDLRNRIGRRTDTVNLVMTNDLQSDFSNSKSPEGAQPKKINPLEFVVSLKRQGNIGKKEGLEKKYGTIFKHTKHEREEFDRVLGLEIKKALK